jgi:hypothetical protein
MADEDNVHPIWEIDDIANSGRNWVWFNPRIAPVIALIRAIIRSLVYLIFIFRMSIGASFCHVNRVNVIGHVKFFATLGNQICVGTRPNLIIMEIIMNNVE